MDLDRLSLIRVGYQDFVIIHMDHIKIGGFRSGAR